MAIKVAVGSDSFEAVIRSGSYYVDKSELIYDLVQETDNTVTLFTRPRRFGKALAMRMMECFFYITRDSRDLFQSLSVAGHADFCREWIKVLTHQTGIPENTYAIKRKDWAAF